MDDKIGYVVEFEDGLFLSKHLKHEDTDQAQIFDTEREAQDAQREHGGTVRPWWLG